MFKKEINGEQWVRLNDVCDILREVRGMDEKRARVVRTIARYMFWDEWSNAETAEEKELALRLPGDFLVVRFNGGSVSEAGYDVFSGFEVAVNGGAEPVLVRNSTEGAKRFTYEEDAAEIAGVLGELAGGEWRVLNMGNEADRIRGRKITLLMTNREREKVREAEAEDAVWG